MPLPTENAELTAHASCSSFVGSRAVLRAMPNPGSSAGFTVSRVEVRDASCGPNEPMMKESDFLYQTLAQQLSLAPSVDLSSVFAPKPTGCAAPSMGVTSNRRANCAGAASLSDVGGKDGSMPRANRVKPIGVSAEKEHAKPCVPLPAVSSSWPGHHPSISSHPTSLAGNALCALGAEAYWRRQELTKFVEDMKRAAAHAKQTLTTEYERRLRDQSTYWQRRVDQLSEQIQHLTRAHEQQNALQHKLLHSSSSYGTTDTVDCRQGDQRCGRSCGGPAPPMNGRRCGGSRGLWERTNPADTAEDNVGTTSSAADDMLPERVMEALLHILQKQPAPTRQRQGGLSPPRQSPRRRKL